MIHTKILRSKNHFSDKSTTSENELLFLLTEAKVTERWSHILTAFIVSTQVQPLSPKQKPSKWAPRFTCSIHWIWQISMIYTEALNSTTSVNCWLGSTLGWSSKL